MADLFAACPAGLESPASRFFAITPSDTVDFAVTTRAIYVGGAGDVVVVDSAGNTCTFVAVPVGSILPIRAKRVNSTSTTATYLVGMY